MEGRARFEAQIRELIQLEEGEEFDVEFECKAPDTGEGVWRAGTGVVLVINLLCMMLPGTGGTWGEPGTDAASQLVTWCLSSRHLTHVMVKVGLTLQDDL